MVDRVINLKNGVSCYVLDELEYKDRKFIFAAEVDKENEDLKDSYLVLELSIKENDDLSVKNIEDFETESAVTNLFLARLNSEENN